MTRNSHTPSCFQEEPALPNMNRPKEHLDKASLQSLFDCLIHVAIFSILEWRNQVSFYLGKSSEMNIPRNYEENSPHQTKYVMDSWSSNEHIYTSQYMLQRTTDAFRNSNTKHKLKYYMFVRKDWIILKKKKWCSLYS